MNEHFTRARPASRTLAALLAIITAPLAMHCSAAAAPEQPPGSVMLAQAVAPTSPPAAAVPMSPAAPSSALTWTFATAQPAIAAWTAETGRLTFAAGETRMQPDANRRVVLLSPPGLPEAARTAENFVLGVPGTGLQRVRIKARRDARGGWITIVDASGKALRETPEGYVVQRRAGARDAPIERLRIEFDFRTTNPRVLNTIVVR